MLAAAQDQLMEPIKPVEAPTLVGVGKAFDEPAIVDRPLRRARAAPLDEHGRA